ncbi:hypothetical protein ABT301_36690 [Streptomyces sp. NPDC000987]|uniref:hypothetical protein n=1 Tax=Streptomyces sp. NPDC000987 TaxID=3154374 RepID=UPI00332EFEDC
MTPARTDMTDSRRKTSPVPTSTTPGLVPYITLREGEEGAPNTLRIAREWPHNRPRLRYLDEEAGDRDTRGVLWSRCYQAPRDEHNLPTGRPLWKLMHPSRQRETMQAMLCQVCVQPARTPLGYVFLAGPDDPEQVPVITAQPPVCKRHITAAARLCPHLDGRPRVYLAQSAPLYGVHGTLYGYGRDGVQVVARPETPLPYGHANLATFLASQLVRRLGSFRTVDLEELLQELRQAA